MEITVALTVEDLERIILSLTNDGDRESQELADQLRKCRRLKK